MKIKRNKYIYALFVIMIVSIIMGCELNPPVEYNDYDFIEHFKEAEILPNIKFETPNGKASFIHEHWWDQAAEIWGTEQETREAIITLPEAKLTFRVPKEKVNGNLVFGIIFPEAKSGNGGIGVITVESESIIDTIYQRFLNPSSNIEERRWYDEIVDLSKYKNKPITITFSINKGPIRVRCLGLVRLEYPYYIAVYQMNKEKIYSRNEPLVSVIIPCYNQGEFLTEAVESVINQTYEDWEIIIVNDGSSDETSEVAGELISQFSNYKINLYEKLNEGPASARNLGIEHSKGKYVLPLDADDKIRSEFLEKTVALLEKYPEISIAYTDLEQFGVENKISCAQEYDFRLIRFNNQLHCCSLFRKEAWETVGGYNPNMPGYEDWDFWISCGEKGFHAKRIPEPLFLYRIKESSRDTHAVKRDEELRARLILNHPNLYTAEFVEKAKNILEKKVLLNKLMNPQISVILPTYSRPEMLESALQSILNQTYKDFEIIVVNDGGADVENVISNLNENKNIVYVKHAFNQGISIVRNTAIKIARGKYIAYLDDDDVFYPDHLETLVRFLEDNNLEVAYTNPYRALQVRENNKYVVKSRELRYSQDFDYDQILVNNFVHPVSMMHKKSCFDEVGMFDESLATHEDWDLLIRLSRKYRIAHINKVTAEFSWRTDRSSLQTEKHIEAKKIFETIYKKYKRYVKDKPQIQETQIRNLKKDFFCNESYALAMELTVIYEQGFYDDEGGWRWMPDEALMEIEYGPQFANQIFVLELTCGDSKSYNRFPFDFFVFQQNNVIAKIHFDSDNQNKKLCTSLPEGMSRTQFRFVSEESFVPALVSASSDVRRLSVRVGNISTIKVENTDIQLVSGWYELEQGETSTYRWIGDEAIALLKLKSDTKKIKITGYIPDIKKYRDNFLELVVEIKNMLVVRKTFTDSGIFIIETDILDKSTNDLLPVIIHLDKFYSPFELGINEDKRKLGVIINSVDLFN